MFNSGQQIGNYTLISRLGRGGFGEVWLAERRAKFVTTKVAVKLPLDEQVDHETIKQEATLWEKASGHPNVLPIIDADEYDGQIIIVSEYAPDGSLDEWLKKHGKIPFEKAVEMTIKILDGLEFLHSRNIIHRDLKPANILLQGETPRLADFGISRALRATASSQSSNVSGTFAYMPPEGFDGKRSIQTDIWSVGVNLYQFLTGVLPFPQKEPSALIAAIMMRDFVPLTSDIPQNLRTVISKALAKNPENRYVSAGQMREDLRRILRGESINSTIKTDLPRTEQSLPVSNIPPTQKSPIGSIIKTDNESETVVRSLPTFTENKSNNSKIWMYATMTLVSVCIIGFGIYFFTQIKKPDSENNLLTQTTNSAINRSATNSENINSTVSSNTNANIETPTPIPTPNKAQLQKLVNQYAMSVKKSLDQNDEQGFKYKFDGAKIVYGDLDKDGDLDGIADMSWREAQSGHITTINTRLAVFSNLNGQFSFLTDIDPGTIGYDPMTFKNGKILVTEYGWTSDDPSCCPSIRNKVAYALQGSKLVKVKR